jgi:CRP-like cAMP-binding protein
MSKERQI